MLLLIRLFVVITMFTILESKVIDNVVRKCFGKDKVTQRKEYYTEYEPWVKLVILFLFAVFTFRVKYETKSTKNKVMLVVFLPFVINLLCIIYDLTKIFILLVDSVLIIGILFTIPFLLKLSNKEEPLW